mmetsp:Transcript_19338/g.43586  ORF Transcript_19338/g.43586 Transcript_19338/m.43586 type:complete len:216 (-) Transcript_19338:951-1598(-)
METVQLARLAVRTCPDDIVRRGGEGNRLVRLVQLAVALRHRLPHRGRGRAQRAVSQRHRRARHTGTVRGMRRCLQRGGMPARGGPWLQLLLHALGADRDIFGAWGELAHLHRPQPAEVRAQLQHRRQRREKEGLHLHPDLVGRDGRHGRRRDGELSSVCVRACDDRCAARRRVGYQQLPPGALRAERAVVRAEPPRRRARHHRQCRHRPVRAVVG